MAMTSSPYFCDLPDGSRLHVSRDQALSMAKLRAATRTWQMKPSQIDDAFKHAVVELCALRVHEQTAYIADFSLL